MLHNTPKESPSLLKNKGKHAPRLGGNQRTYEESTWFGLSLPAHTWVEHVA